MIATSKTSRNVGRGVGDLTLRPCPSRLPSNREAAAAALLEMDFEESAATVTCGVYVLMRGEEVLYVGRSTQVEARVLHHRLVRGLDFDRVFVSACGSDDLGRLEVEAIRRCRPTQNVQHNPAAPPIVVATLTGGRPLHISSRGWQVHRIPRLALAGKLGRMRGLVNRAWPEGRELPKLG